MQRGSERECSEGERERDCSDGALELFASVEVREGSHCKLVVRDGVYFAKKTASGTIHILCGLHHEPRGGAWYATRPVTTVVIHPHTSGS